MRLRFLAMVLSVPITFNALATTEFLTFTPEKISTELNLGTLSSKTKERVYAPEEGGRKASQLDWKYSNAAIIKGAINWDLLPVCPSMHQAGQPSVRKGEIWLTVTGWTQINLASGLMRAGIPIPDLILPMNLT